MAELIVVDKIDGNPVAWRCSQCRQVFSIPGKLTTEERRRKINSEFRTHLQQAHAAEKPVANTKWAPGQVCSA